MGFATPLKPLLARQATTNYPEGSGPSFTGFFLPKGFAAGLRLELSGADLWNAFFRAYAQAQLTGTPESQMDYFTRATESLLLQGVNFDDQSLKLDKSYWARGRGVGVRQRAAICRCAGGLTGIATRSILIIPIPKTREKDLAEARRLNERDAQRGAVDLDNKGADSIRASTIHIHQVEAQAVKRT